MNIVNLSCTNCGAPIQVPPDAERLRCPYCSSNLEIQRSQGNVALKFGEQVSRSIEDVGTQTRDTIQQGTETTQTELKRLQLSQQVSMLQMQLSTLQSEIRSLQREKPTKKIKKQINDLKQQEASLMNQIRSIQATLVNIPVVQVARQPGQTTSRADSSVSAVYGSDVLAPAQPKNWLTAYLLCLFLGIFGAHRFYTGYKTLGIVQLLTMGGFLIWWIIDLFLLTFGKFKDSKGNVLNNPGGKARIVVIVISVIWLLMCVMITGIASQS